MFKTYILYRENQTLTAHTTNGKFLYGQRMEKMKVGKETNGKWKRFQYRSCKISPRFPSGYGYLTCAAGSLYEHPVKYLGTKKDSFLKLTFIYWFFYVQ